MAASTVKSATANSRRPLRTAGCIIIGDEVLGGKTKDTNSSYFADYCFELGISLKRIEVIPDEEDDIVECVRRMSSRYDLVVTSGGIGPTHDDITYSSIAAAFSLPLVEHAETLSKMKLLSSPHKRQPDFDWDTPSPALEAKKRMVRLPHDSSLAPDSSSSSSSPQVLFVDPGLWVPIAVVNGNIHILPGIPRLFEQLLQGLKPRLQDRIARQPPEPRATRIIILTPLPESAVAPYLTELAARLEGRVKVGSYPRWGRTRNEVTLVGSDVELMEGLVPEVESAVEGRRVRTEADDVSSSEGE